MGTRLIIFSFLLGMSGEAAAQHVTEGERKGLLQVTGKLYPSLMLNHAVRNNYVGGHAVYYVEDHFSFRGDLLGYAGAQTDRQYLQKHIESTVGIGWHFGRKRWDPYLYGQIGMGAVRLQESGSMDYQPVTGIAFGANFHVAPYFYFYAETVFRHMNDPLHPRNLDQLLFTGGLGLQLPTRK